MPPPSFKCNKRLTPYTFISIKGHPFTLALELKGSQGLATPLIKHKYLDPLNVKLEFYSKLKGIIIVYKAFTKFFDAKSHMMIWPFLWCITSRDTIDAIDAKNFNGPVIVRLSHLQEAERSKKLLLHKLMKMGHAIHAQASECCK